MKIVIKHLLFLFILFIPYFGITQDIRFKHLSINEGLSQNAVFSITQCSEGFMWFGTKDGLNKYNGYNFKVYQHNPNNANTIKASHITSLYNDKVGNLWIGGENGILNRYLKNTESFLRIPLPLANSMGNNSYEINEINEDKNGTIWVGTRNNGLFRVPLVKNKVIKSAIKQYSNNETGKYKITNNTIRALYSDNSNNLWIGTNKGLNRMNLETEEFEPFYFDIKHPDAMQSYRDMAISSIHSNENGILWLGTLSGLIRFNTVDYSFEVFKHNYTVHRYGWGEITKIIEDSNGNFWLSSLAELMHFDTKTKTFTYHRNDPLKPHSLNYNSVSSLYIDKSNIVWVGTTGMGINYYDPKAHRFSILKRTKNEKINSRVVGFSVRSVFEESDRYVWVSSDVLYRWDRKTNTLKSFEKNSNNLNSFGNTGAWSITKSRDGNLWFSTTEGLYVYNPFTSKTKQFKYNKDNPDGIPQKNVLAVFEDDEEYLWIATENYLCKMTDRKKGVFKKYPYIKGAIYSVFGRPVLYQDIDSKIWIGTKIGLLVFDPEKETFHTFKNNPENANSLINNNIKSICPDPEQPERFIWIGTAGGLNLFDKKEKIFTHFTKENGLPNNVIYGILPDHQNNLWISTNKGISKFNPKNKTFRNFDVYDGLQSNEFNTGAYHKSKKGELFFGGISGLNYFFPEQIKNNPFIPSVVLTDIKVHNNSNKDSKKNSFKTIPFLEKEELTFTHKDNSIIFEFAAMDFSVPLKNQYAYKLDNFNKDWIYTNNNRTATFTNLPAGKYVFRGKASNNHGVWNETGLSIPFQVLPHWSATWWAYFLYLLLLLLLLYLARRYELKRFHIKNQLEVERIKINSLRSLDQLKSKFFTNISHEFRTPLTLISGEAERLLEKLKIKQTRKQVKTIDRNAKRLLQLINQLLDVSKLDARKMKLILTQSNVVLFLKNVFYSFESLAEKKKIQFEFISEHTNIQVLFDSGKMEKIIGNLLSNALKFTPENGRITLQMQQKNTEIVTIFISDTGIGISKADIPYIFDRFYQVDNSDTRVFEGTGIGLALVKELTLLHKGKIMVVNNATTLGVTFILEIPIGKIIENKEFQEEPLITNHYPIATLENNTFNTIPTPHFNKKVILLVEDNIDIRQFIKEQLHLNYKIIEAVDGEKGIEISEKTIPDLIITDVMMPKVDGFAMVKHIKENEKTSHIPIIMLTGKSSYEDKIKGLETGIDAFLTKPFSTKELQIRISKLLAQRELLRKKYKNAFSIIPENIAVSSIDQKFLKKTLKHLEENLDNPNFSVDKLADKMCLSSSQLHRKLHALINQAPGQLLRNMRLQKAAELIKLNIGSITDICFQTGFNDQAYFSRAFKNHFGCSPLAYKKETT